MNKTEFLSVASAVPGEYIGTLAVMDPFALKLAGGFALVAYASVQAGHALYEAGQLNEKSALAKQAKVSAEEIQ